MFAVIKTGGKQYRVAENDVIAVERLAGEPGEAIELADVLMIGEDGKTPTVGTPMVDKASVSAQVIEQGKGDKVIIFKKTQRQGYRRKRGHRQDLTILRVTGINPTGKKAAPKKAAAKKPAEEPKAEAEAAAPADAEAKPKAAKKTAKTEE